MCLTRVPAQKHSVCVYKKISMGYTPCSLKKSNRKMNGSFLLGLQAFGDRLFELFFISIDDILRHTRFSYRKVLFKASCGWKDLSAWLPIPTFRFVLVYTYSSKVTLSTLLTFSYVCVHTSVAFDTLLTATFLMNQFEVHMFVVLSGKISHA